MNPWEMFCELVRNVVEGQNCILEVFISKEGISMHLTPCGDMEGDDE